MSPRTRTTPDDPAEPAVSADGGAAADGGLSTDGGAAADAGQDDSTEGLTYEQARDELVQVVGRLEAGGVPLEDSLALWERGEALAARCQRWLDGARARLDAALASEDDTRGH